jgi:hypothetical protein
MPMQVPADFGAQNTSCAYCRFCAPCGVLKSRGEVRAGWVDFIMRTECLTREEAEKKVDAAMAVLPAWAGTMSKDKGA